MSAGRFGNAPERKSNSPGRPGERSWQSFHHRPQNRPSNPLLASCAKLACSAISSASNLEVAPTAKQTTRVARLQDLYRLLRLDWQCRSGHECNLL